jgi:hypothetical protein
MVPIDYDPVLNQVLLYYRKMYYKARVFNYLIFNDLSGLAYSELLNKNSFHSCRWRQSCMIQSQPFVQKSFFLKQE